MAAMPGDMVTRKVELTQRPYFTFWGASCATYSTCAHFSPLTTPPIVDLETPRIVPMAPGDTDPFGITGEFRELDQV